jgi:UDP-N-acetylmuramate: L-alanyl-gamma-D-glutamyl-meso-diaminopimelate ligase
MKLGEMKSQLPWSLEQANLIFCHTAGLDWDAVQALAAMSDRAHTAGDIDTLVAQVKAAARPGDHVLCMSNGGFGGVHNKLLLALKT